MNFASSCNVPAKKSPSKVPIAMALARLRKNKVAITDFSRQVQSETLYFDIICFSLTDRPQYFSAKRSYETL